MTIKVPDKYWVAFVYLALTIITLAVFWQVRSFAFTNYDDNYYVSENKHVLSGLTIDNCVWAFTCPHYFMWHPLTTLSNMLDCRFFDLNAGRHHLTNLILHIANTLLLFGILKQMTGRIWPSAFVAALFALHPLNVESVAWVAERKNVLSTFFWMLTVAAYIRYVKSTRLSNYLLVIFIFSFALMSKPTTVTLPFVLLLLDFWPLNRAVVAPDGKIKWQIWLHLIREKIPFFVLSVVLCVITIFAQKSGNVLKLNEYFPFAVRLSNALVSYVLYIGKMIYPLHLAVFYPHSGYSLPLWKPIASFVVLASASIAAICLGRRHRYLFIGWFWFLGTLVPVIGLIQAGEQAMADRYAYVPLIGLFIIIAWGTSDLLAKWKYQKITLGLSAPAIILVLSICSWFQTSYRRDSRTLFEHALKVTDRNHLAYNKVAFALMEQGKYDEAINLIQRALQFKPYYVEALNNLGFSYTKLDRWPEAVEIYKRAVKIRPAFSNAQYNLGIACLHLGRTSEAIDAFRQAVKPEPDYTDAHYSLGAALLQLGQYPEAIKAFKKTIELKPDYAEAHFYLGVAHTRMGNTTDAIEAFKQAVKIKPDFAQAWYYLGAAYGKLGPTQDEMEAYGQAIKFKPDYAEVLNNLGAVYSQLGRNDEALQTFKQAVAAKPDYAEAYNNLGILFDQLGRFEEAADAYTNVTRIKPGDADAYNNLGTAFGRLGRNNDAIQAFQQAVRIKPDFVEAHYNLGITLLAVGDKDSALTEYEILKKLDVEKAKALIDIMHR